MLTAALQNLENQRFGFEQDGRLVVAMNPKLGGYRAGQLSPLYRRIHDSVAGIPGVTSVALCLYSPPRAGCSSTEEWTMKFLDAKRRAGQQENKMQPGSRVDQRNPEEPHTSATSKISLGPDKPKIRPEVQKLADELNVDLDKVKGTGVNGIILVKDVRAFKAQELDDELEPESTEKDPLDLD